MLNPNASITLRQAENSVAERYDALVLGAGVVGVNTAYFLAKAGKSVSPSTDNHRPGSRPVSPTAVRCRSATPSRGQILALLPKY